MYASYFSQRWKIWKFGEKKTAAGSRCSLVDLYEEDSIGKTQCFERFQQFKSGDLDIRDKERPGQPKKFVDEELGTLLDENPCRTLEELVESLNFDQATISRRLKALRMIQ